MNTALIIYQSKTGITKRFGEELGQYLSNKGLTVKVMSIQEYDTEIPDQYDLIFLGCWTSGLMLIFQHPDRPWVQFVKRLPDLKDKKIVLFATYKLATGSMFKKMRKHLSLITSSIQLELKSRNGTMNDSHKQLIDSLIV